MYFNLTDEIKRYPFIRITLPLILGIVLAINTNPSLIFCGIISIIFILVFVIINLVKKHRLPIAKGLLINLIFISLGMMLVATKAESIQSESLNNYKGFIVGEISDDPKISDKTTTLDIQINAIKNKDQWIAVNGNTLVYVENDSRTKTLKAGDKIIFSPELSEIENQGNPEEFDYEKYLAYNLIFNSDFLASDEWDVFKGNYSSDINNQFLRFRQDLIAQLAQNGVKDDELAVISALALGYKDKLSDDIRHSYASSGAMHILAVSGLHVGIIYGILVFLFSFIKNEKLKIPKTILIIIIIWFYAALTGLSPSVNRAALMFTIMAVGSLQKRPAGSLNAIAISAFILLIINPYNITNIGFQLSYAAVIGIIILYPKIYAIFEVKNKFIDKIWSLTAVSIAAQIATAPIGLFYFHQFSNYFILANYLLIPVSTIAIWLCIAVFIVSAIGIPTGFLIKPLVWSVKSMNFISSGIESLPFSVSENIYISGLQLVILYLIIISFGVFFFSSKKYKHFFIGLAGVIVFATTNLIANFNSSKQELFIVYNINKASAINIIDGKDNIMFANIDSVSNDKIEFSTKNNWLKCGLDEEKYINTSSNSESLLSNLATIDNNSVFFKRKFIGYKNLRIFISDDCFYPALYDFEKKTKVDFIILSNNSAAKLSNLVSIFDFEQIIIDSNNSQKSIDHWLRENDTIGLKIHNVKTDGAFIYDLQNI